MNKSYYTIPIEVYRSDHISDKICHLFLTSRSRCLQRPLWCYLLCGNMGTTHGAYYYSHVIIYYACIYTCIGEHTLTSHMPSPQQAHVTIPSGEAQTKGYSALTNSSTLRLWWLIGDKDVYLSWATFSWSQPQQVAAVLNLLISGWHVNIMRPMEDDAGLVWEAALKREAVILSVLVLNHRGDLYWDLVFNSTASICCCNMLMSHVSQISAIHRNS